MTPGRPRRKDITPKIKAEINRAIEFFGGPVPTAKRFAIKRQAVEYWQKRGVPIDRAQQIERASKGKFLAVNLYVQARGD